MIPSSVNSRWSQPTEEKYLAINSTPPQVPPRRPKNLNIDGKLSVPSWEYYGHNLPVKFRGGKVIIHHARSRPQSSMPEEEYEGVAHVRPDSLLRPINHKTEIRDPSILRMDRDSFLNERPLLQNAEREFYFENQIAHEEDEKDNSDDNEYSELTPSKPKHREPFKAGEQLARNKKTSQRNPRHEMAYFTQGMHQNLSVSRAEFSRTINMMQSPNSANSLPDANKLRVLQREKLSTSFIPGNTFDYREQKTTYIRRARRSTIVSSIDGIFTSIYRYISHRRSAHGHQNEQDSGVSSRELNRQAERINQDQISEQFEALATTPRPINQVPEQDGEQTRKEEGNATARFGMAQMRQQNKGEMQRGIVPPPLPPLPPCKSNSRCRSPKQIPARPASSCLLSNASFPVFPALPPMRERLGSAGPPAIPPKCWHPAETGGSKPVAIPASRIPHAHRPCYPVESDSNFRMQYACPSPIERHSQRDHAVQCELPFTQQEQSDHFSYLNVASTTRTIQDNRRDPQTNSHFEGREGKRGMNELQLRHRASYAASKHCTTQLEKSKEWEEAEQASINTSIYLNLECTEEKGTSFLDSGDVSVGPASYRNVAQPSATNEQKGKSSSKQSGQVLHQQ